MIFMRFILPPCGPPCIFCCWNIIPWFGCIFCWDWKVWVCIGFWPRSCCLKMFWCLGPEPAGTGTVPPEFCGNCPNWFDACGGIPPAWCLALNIWFNTCFDWFTGGRPIKIRVNTTVSVSHNLGPCVCTLKNEKLTRPWICPLLEELLLLLWRWLLLVGISIVPSLRRCPLGVVWRRTLIHNRSWRHLSLYCRWIKCVDLKSTSVIIKF